MRVAVIGGGISGLGAAWALSRRFEVTVFEAAGRPGGHSNTISLALNGRDIPVDTGFIVFNERNYPNLTRLFSTLGVTTEASEMSFSVSVDRKFEYAGDLRGFLAQPANLCRPRTWRMVSDILRFYREAPGLAAAPSATEESVGDVLRRQKYSGAFIDDHLLPMAAAIWSTSRNDILEFPFAAFSRFFENHGLLQLRDRPQWRTVSGGSRQYVDRLVASFRDRLRLGCGIVAAERSAAGVDLTTVNGDRETFDHVVFATHADQTLSILGESANRLEREILGAFRYARNQAVLHSDTDMMPRRRGTWSSWNYIKSGRAQPSQPCTVTYWMNRLQNLDCDDPVLVTLNPMVMPAPDLTFATFEYDHPLFDRGAIDAQSAIGSIQGDSNIWYCGSYLGYGFHEDGLASGLSVAASLGAPPPWFGEIVERSPAAANARPRRALPLPEAA